MTVYGVDLSHFDAPDARAMFGDGISFMTHKAGGDSNDPELGAWWNYVEGYRSPSALLGAYWVLYPGSPVARADQFVARLDSQCPGWRDGPFILQADCEIWGGNSDTAPSITEINAFCDRLAERLPKLNPIAYAPDWVYGGKVSALRYPIWASSYVSGSGGYRDLYPGDGARQWDPYGGRGPSILQYSSSTTIGGQSTCDADAFRGTLKQLTQLLAPGWGTVAMLDNDDKAWLAAQFAAVTAFDAAQADGSATSKIGRLVWGQGIPDGTLPVGSPRVTAWQTQEALGQMAETVLAQVSVNADPTAIAAALLDAGIGLAVAKAIISQLGTPGITF